MRLRCRLLIAIVLLCCCVKQYALAEKDSPTTPTATKGELPSISDLGVNLGVQVRRAMMMRSDVGLDRDGRHVLYTVLMGNPAMLAIVDVLTGDVIEHKPLPMTSGAWGVLVSTDNTVYFAAYNQGLVYRYFPDTGELKNLGRPFKTHDTVLYPMAAAPDGTIYGGSYPSGHAYAYDPKSEKFTDLGDMTTSTVEERWIRVTIFDRDSNSLYMGVGNQPQLVRYDLESGEKENLLPARHSNITSVYDLNVEAGRLFCRKETHNPYEYFVLDMETGDDVTITNADTGETSTTFINGSRGLSQKSPVANKMYYVALDRKLWEYDLDTNTIKSLDAKFPSVATGYKWVELKDEAWPGWTLVGTTGNAGDLYKYNLETGRHESKSVEYVGQPINIHDIETGPDGRIYSGGYLAGNMGIYDPKSSAVTHLSGSGQTEGLVFVGHKLYMGVYPGARIYEYDTQKPWNPGNVWNREDKTPRNPTQIFQMEDNPEIPGYTNQDRPFAMAGSEELGKLFVGTVPKNGMLGGALAVWDVEKRGDPEIYWNLVPDQSIVSLVVKGNFLYGGTSLYGGMGTEPKAKEPVLFVWDITQKKLVHTAAVAPGKPAITQLTVGPDGNIWGLAGGVLFAFNPETRKVLHSRDEFPGVSTRMRDGSLVTGRDGLIYGVAGGKVFRVDPETRQTTILATGADKLAVGHDGMLYVSGSPITELQRIEP